MQTAHIFIFIGIRDFLDYVITLKKIYCYSFADF